jgi:hypothetical protein
MINSIANMGDEIIIGVGKQVGILSSWIIINTIVGTTVHF